MNIVYPKGKSRMKKRNPYETRGRSGISIPDLNSYGKGDNWSIPTENPEEALRFCRALSYILNDRSGENLAFIENNKFEVMVDYTPEISVVIPVYDEEENLTILHERLTKVFSNELIKYEIIFVDDGSRDRSLELMQNISSRDQQVIVIELARNFGHQVAISAGLDYARGKGVIIMDADLQDPPEVLPEFIEKWREGHDVVYAIRTNRKESWLKRHAYSLFYRLLQRIASIEIPLDAGDFCIMDRKIVDVLINMPERNRFVRGIRSWVGLNQIGLAYDRQARYAGKPKFTFSRLIYLALDGLVSFSFVPLRTITIIGFIVSAFSILFAFGYAIKRLISGLNPPGFATLVVAVFFLAGIQLVTIGVIGEYVGRIFEEVKRRPLYIIRRISGGNYSCEY